MQAEAVLLSLLGPRPVFWRNPKFPDVLAAWNGMCMTQGHALMLAEERFWGSNPTPEMKHVADRRLMILHSAGAFENSTTWVGVIEENQGSMHNWYRKKLKLFFDRDLKDAKPSEVFNWFNLKEWAKN
jgi:hypothetical protein